MGNSRNEMSALYLIQTYCLPSLLYSCETWYLNSCDMKRVEVAWNNAFWKIFNAFWYESVKPLQYYCSSLSRGCDFDRDSASSLSAQKLP